MPLFLCLSWISSRLIDGPPPMDHSQASDHLIVIVDRFYPEASDTVPLRLGIDSILVEFENDAMRCVAHLVDLLASCFEKLPRSLV